jgi:hypothetical protein
MCENFWIPGFNIIAKTTSGIFNWILFNKNYCSFFEVLILAGIIASKKIIEGDICTYAEAQQTFHYCTSLVRRLLFTNH